MEAAPIVRSKMPELDTIRGIAILSVLFYHGFFWSNGVTGLQGAARLFVQLTRFGWLGVNLFFVLSGFLITGILVESKQRIDYYKRFYIRRALRILPAFYALLLVLALMPSQNGRYLFLSFFYLSNLAPLFAIPMTYAMPLSLAVEAFLLDMADGGAKAVIPMADRLGDSSRGGGAGDSRDGVRAEVARGLHILHMVREMAWPRERCWLFL